MLMVVQTEIDSNAKHADEPKCARFVTDGLGTKFIKAIDCKNMVPKSEKKANEHK